MKRRGVDAQTSGRQQPLRKAVLGQQSGLLFQPPTPALSRSPVKGAALTPLIVIGQDDGVVGEAGDHSNRHTL